MRRSLINPIEINSKCTDYKLNWYECRINLTFYSLVFDDSFVLVKVKCRLDTTSSNSAGKTYNWMKKNSRVL